MPTTATRRTLPAVAAVTALAVTAVTVLAARPAAAQAYVAASASRTSAESAGRVAPPARPALRFEAVAAAPDTVTMAQLARGVPLALQIVEPGGRPLAAAVQWRIVSGDAAFTEVAARADEGGYAKATLGRAPWSLARPGRVVVEARTRAKGMDADSTIRIAFELVRR